MAKRKKLFIFEDETYLNFYPLSLSHPVYELLCGISRLREKIEYFFPDYEINLLCRPHLDSVLAQESGLKVNQLTCQKKDEILLLSGRVLASPELKHIITSEKKQVIFMQKESFVGAFLSGKTILENREKLLGLYKKENQVILAQKFSLKKIKANLVSYLWDFVDNNGSEIERDFRLRKKVSNRLSRLKVDSKAVIYQPEKVILNEGVEISAYAVLDASGGPIYLSRNVQVRPFTLIEGPAFIGEGSILLGAKIRPHTSIGPVCRVGGEVENSILLGYDNKYHEGFLGHSYLGEWVNLGAMTTNSDLKNNYSNIRVKLPQGEVDSGKIKVGCFLGDHCKTGIGTLLNSGMVLGLGTNVFGGGMPAEKFLPSFSWNEKDTAYELEKFIQTARIVMERRKKKLTRAYEKLYQEIFNQRDREI